MLLFRYTAKCFKHTNNFKGSATRSEYGYFQLFLTMMALLFVGLYAMARGYFSHYSDTVIVVGISLWTLWCAVIFLPSIAVTVRKLHAISKRKRSRFFFYAIIPVLIRVILVVWAFIVL